ncbi:hypothetical protein [Flavobacterium capsici]|uniref:Uncharacterized protein n=1 Tax=Flavobacterium capsici TaxID=3075618 RepID=A0AA96J9G8_9FLAO|nr:MULTISPECIES: hypothetical protein [unclassified Flavobacterium]WNM19130.1 hypothetical protein RN608_00255 [Flavobacterium sp. PMR2A8]WNM20519.1 hypothetical protein RN605_07425 [Flavobacterium sp. PMTSA4]
MKKNTFKDYKKALLEHYDTVKGDDVTGVLLDPTPAQMRDLCSLKIDGGLSKTDEELMRVFFETKKEDSLKLSIKRCNIDKFRPIISFIRRETDTDNRPRIELVAILIDFSPRPYAKFSGLKNETSKSKDSGRAEDENITDLSQTNKKQKTYSFKKILYVFLGLIGLSSLGYVVKDKLIPEKQCMQWQDDHYVEVNCLEEINGFKSSSKKPIKEELMNLEKIKVCDTTTFFEEGKAIVYYCKIDNDNVEYFNQPGYHPINGKPLKPITTYMINKYIKNKE